MLETLLVVVVRALTLTLRGHRKLILENLAAATAGGPQPVARQFSIVVGVSAKLNRDRFARASLSTRVLYGQSL